MWRVVYKKHLSVKTVKKKKKKKEEAYLHLFTGELMLYKLLLHSNKWKEVHC